MLIRSWKKTGFELVCGLIVLLLSGTALAQKSPEPPDPRDLLEQFVRQHKIEYDDAAISFYLQLLDAGCRPEEAHRWTRMALFVDEVWNLAELSGLVEEQRLAGATRQVVEAEVEKRIRQRAAELQVDLGRFPAAFAATPGAQPAKAAPSRGKSPSK